MLELSGNFMRLLNVAIPATSRMPVLTFAVPAIPVSADQSIAGSADGNLASGIVPDDRLLAFKDDPVMYPAPFVS